MNDASSHSARFRRAAIAESERLLRRQGRAAEQVASIETKLAEAKRELAEILDRLEKLRSLAGDVATPRPIEVAPLPPGVALSGAEIRKVAVRLLRASGKEEQPIHYRQWLNLVEEAGFAVRGKRPEAVFLGQIVRSPVVKATTQSGYYELDREAPGRLRDRIAALESAAVEMPSHSTNPAELDGQIDRERDRSLEIRKLQRSLREALEVLDDAAPEVRVAA